MVIELDNRGLEPPEPMMRILAAVEQLGADDSILARNDRVPMFLFPMLEERGLKYSVTELPDGSAEIRVYR